MPSLITIPLALVHVSGPPPLRPGLFAAQGVSIGEAIAWDGPPDKPMHGRLVVPSPDGRSKVLVTYREWGNELSGNFRTMLSVRVAGRAGPAAFHSRYVAVGDVLWSPDSRHVAISLSGGGLGGVYDLFVLGGGRKATPNSAPFRRRLNPPKNCDLRAFSNVVPIKWLSTARLLVMARQLFEDSCPQKNRAMFYDYDLRSGTIGRSYGAAAAKRAFGGSLGALAR